MLSIVTRPVIASTANTTCENWRSVVADKCGVKTVKSDIISGMGECPFKVIVGSITLGHLPNLFNYFGEGIDNWNILRALQSR